MGFLWKSINCELTHVLKRILKSSMLSVKKECRCWIKRSTTSLIVIPHEQWGCRLVLLNPNLIAVTSGASAYKLSVYETLMRMHYQCASYPHARMQAPLQKWPHVSGRPPWECGGNTKKRLRNQGINEARHSFPPQSISPLQGGTPAPNDLSPSMHQPRIKVDKGNNTHLLYVYLTQTTRQTAADLSPDPQLAPLVRKITLLNPVVSVQFHFRQNSIL